MTGILALVLVGSASAGAPPGEARTLAEHRFVIPQHLSSAWITTHVAFRQGIGWLGVPDYRYPGIPTQQPLNLLGLSESLEGQVRLKPWLAVWVRGSGAVHTGVDTRSVLFVGGRGTYDLRGAVRVRLVRTERTQLAAHLGVQRFDALGIVPADLAVAVLDDPQGVVPDLLAGRWDSLLVSERGTRGTLGLAGGWAVSPRVGLQASLTGRAGTTTAVTSRARASGLDVQVGAGLVGELRPTGGPGGVQLGVRNRIERDPALTDTLPTDVRSGLDLTSLVFYDRSDLTLGVVLDAATASAFGTRQWELGLEGRAMAFF